MEKINNFNDKDVYDIAVIGGGPGGIAALLEAEKAGNLKTILIERNSYLGGILPQCIHGGFGLKLFKKELTGPEYNQIFVDEVYAGNLNILTGTMALKIEEDDSGIKKVILASRDKGYFFIKAKAIVLALGCRERTRGQILIPGSRPSGIYTAGLVQKMVNIEGWLPGKDIVILGSGDIGLIMARRLFLEGCNVKGVYELMPYSTGLSRNIAQCLDDYGIPLHLSHTVTKIYGEKRLEAVEISKVDSSLKPIENSSNIVKCDTLLLSVGLICENELSKTAGILIDKKTGGPFVDENFQTSVKGIFACGNSLFVNDIVDDVTKAGYIAGRAAVQYAKGSEPVKNDIEIVCGENAAYVLPQKISAINDVLLRIRAKRPIKNAQISIDGISFKRKYNIVIPGEMVFINIKKEELKKLKQGPLLVNIEQL